MSALKYTACQLVRFTYAGRELEGVVDFAQSGQCDEQATYDIETSDGSMIRGVLESDIAGVVQ